MNGCMSEPAAEGKGRLPIKVQLHSVRKGKVLFNGEKKKKKFFIVNSPRITKSGCKMCFMPKSRCKEGKSIIQPHHPSQRSKLRSNKVSNPKN